MNVTIKAAHLVYWEYDITILLAYFLSAAVQGNVAESAPKVVDVYLE